MLTPHQEEVTNEALNILSISDRLIIKGSAGVGKTYMSDELIKQLRAKYGGTFYCAAPTNKAVSVLKDKLTKNALNSLITAQKALKIKRFIDKITGNISFKPDFDERYPPLKGVKVFLIDEASMLPTYLLLAIEQYATRFKVKVIFIGKLIIADVKPI